MAPLAPDDPAGRDVFVYFDNDAKVHAPFDALRLAERLRGVPADVAREGQNHGDYRWRQGYDVAEVVTEFGHLRAALRRSTADFARANGWDLTRYESAQAVIDDVLDEVLHHRDDGARRMLSEIEHPFTFNKWSVTGSPIGMTSGVEKVTVR